MTYQNLKPFLKGFYATLNEWRADRDEEGWKLSHRAYQRFLHLGRRSDGDSDGLESTSEEEDTGAPALVSIMPLMHDHVRASSDMFKPTQPVLLLKQGSSRFDALYIFGDASGLGFGSLSWVSGKENRLNYRYGLWGMSADESSSNYRELRNSVKSLDRSGSLGTDNSTAEAVIHKGSSSSPLLYELVVRLYKLASSFLFSALSNSSTSRTLV